ncbi:hypothetical protein GOP47_0000192 [Adiantum capillus-veneris]|uniref:DOG1 domain-containing protein n=1 Tax=Adiantum capillus-veneris TaxID=13818 RepID=A0A9D4ZQH7_ADICA|nr:hypothetical protein GOP47_0000192 [Adiantum capillus-veneris]
MQIWFPLTMQGQHPKVAQATGHELDSSTLQRDEVWCDWKKLVQSLRLALESKSCDSQLRQLVNECMALYRASCTIPPTTDNILASISGRHSSQLEAAFMWLGAWRPSSAITLVYSKTGDTMGKCDGLESSTPPPCMLSESQISIMEALREHTCRAEVEISSSLASVQMLLADQNMTEAFGIGSPLDGMQATLSDSEDVEAQRLMNNGTMCSCCV